MSKKIIIFDMDGTLYDLNDVLQMCFNMQVDFLSKKRKLTKEETIVFFAEHHIYPVIKKDSISATELFLEIGIDKKEWSNYRDSNFDVKKIDKRKAVNEEVIRDFSRYGILVLLSSNAYSVLEKVLGYLNISPEVFDDIICSNRFPIEIPFKKKLAMEHLSMKYQVPFDEMISIGDRFKTDIAPILELRGKGILLKKPAYLCKVLEDFKTNSLASCDLYEYYE